MIHGFHVIDFELGNTPAIQGEGRWESRLRCNHEYRHTGKNAAKRCRLCGHYETRTYNVFGWQPTKGN